KYAGQKDAEATLITHVMKGSKGVWGPVPMPANAQVNEAEAKKLVGWVLSLK
ncbi:MAG: cytochrome C', partial [Giesbergeria sp.]|nr:cytochrome C' [Giesbergeria sp.]